MKQSPTILHENLYQVNQSNKKNNLKFRLPPFPPPKEKCPHSAATGTGA